MNKRLLDRFTLEDQVVLITGGAGLVGQHYCRAVSEAGGIPIIGDLSIEKSKIITQNIPKGYALELDVSSQKSIETAFKKIDMEFGRLDGLVNNAAYNAPATKDSPNFKELEDFPLYLWERSLSVDLTGSLLCTQAATKFFKRQKKGNIVNISSTYGCVGPDQSIYEDLKDPANPNARFVKPISYSTTKGAIQNFTRYLATYFGPFGVRANTLTLGGVFDHQNPSFVKNYIKKTPIGRMAQADDYACALIFLLSEASSYMTGSNLIIDGGWTSW